MQAVFLHGFASNPQIWRYQKPEFAPALDFENLGEEGRRVERLIGSEAILVGWSMGGMLALKIAAAFPKKVKALVLVSTTPKFIRSNDFPCALPKILLDGLAKKIDAEGISAFHRLVVHKGQDPGMENISSERAKRELAELARVDLRSVLGGLKMPVLIIHGQADDICRPGAAQFMRDKIKNCRLEMLDDAGHAPMLDAPEKFNSILQSFIGQNGG